MDERIPHIAEGFVDKVEAKILCDRWTVLDFVIISCMLMMNIRNTIILFGHVLFSHSAPTSAVRFRLFIYLFIVFSRFLVSFLFWRGLYVNLKRLDSDLWWR